MTTVELVAIRRKHMNSKELLDIVYQLEERQKELETQVAEIEKQLSERNEAHAIEIAHLQQEHLDEMARFADQLTDGKSHSSKLCQMEEQILLTLSQENFLTTEAIASMLKLNKQVVELHMSEMDAQGLVVFDYDAHHRRIWHLSHKGRRYLIQQNLLD